jgi:hypothetical protein
MLNFLEYSYWALRREWLQRIPFKASLEIGPMQPNEGDVKFWAAQEKELAVVDWDKEFEGVKKWVYLDPYTKVSARNLFHSYMHRLESLKVGDVFRCISNNRDEYAIARISESYFQICIWDWNVEPSSSRERWRDIGYMSVADIRWYEEVEKSE